MRFPGSRCLVLFAATLLGGCSGTSTRPVVPDPGPPEGRQVGPAGWLVLGGALAWSAATNEILATGRVQSVPPSDAEALHAISATTGAYRVVDGVAIRLSVSESGADVFLATANVYPEGPRPACPAVVRCDVSPDGTRLLVRDNSPSSPTCP